MATTKKQAKVGYVDGFIIPVKKDKLAAYRKMATLGKKIWLKYGAIDYKECVAEDGKPKGIVLTFPKLAKTKNDEVVIFSYIGFKSRAHRDAVNKKVMADPLMNDPKYTEKQMPFDMKRFAYGGFKVMVG